jgi:hypothetical protein
LKKKSKAKATYDRWCSDLEAYIGAEIGEILSTESKYIGLSNTSQHLAWLRAFFEDIGHAQTKPTELFCDNQAVIILLRGPQFRARSKHIARKFHSNCDNIVGKGQVMVCYVNTNDQVANIMTKSLSHDKHWHFVRAMGLVMPNQP